MTLKEEFTKTGNWLFRRRSYLPLLVLPLLLLALQEPKYLKQTAGWTAEYLWEGFCAVLSFTGLLIRCAVIGYAPKRTSGRNTDGQKADVLNTTGVYSFVRHPLYLGNFFIFLGIAFFTQAVWFIIFSVLSFWLYYERIMFAEEEFLSEKFGEAFLRWAEQTPAFLPKLKNWRQPALTFSFRNILKREYNAFFLITSSFSMLDLSGDIIRQERLRVEDLIWMIIFIAGFIIYLILRTLKKKTKLLTVADR